MADTCPTVKIAPTHPSQGAFVEINAEDFDPAVHVPYVEACGYLPPEGFGAGKFAAFVADAHPPVRDEAAKVVAAHGATDRIATPRKGGRRKKVEG